MPALAEFLKGTVNDALTKVLQPAGLIPGALFILLNLAIVLPAATANNVGIATTYSGLASAVQVIVVGSLILVVGYLLLASSGAVLDTLAGRTWRMSILGTVMRAERDRRRDKLEARIGRMYAEGSDSDIERLDELLWRRRTRTAPSERKSTPTALGDVLLASEHAIRARYGLSVPALWEPLRAALATDDQAASAADSAKATLDVTANLTFAIVVFVFEAVIVFTLLEDHSAVLFTLTGMAVSYVAYRVTVAKAVSWCDAIDTTVALNAHRVLDKLGIRDATSGPDRRALLERASDFMVRDAPDDDLFGPVAPPEPVLTSSPNLTATAHQRETRYPAIAGTSAATHRESIAFTLLVTTAKDTMPWTRGTLIFADPRLPRLSPTPPDADLLRGGSGKTTSESLRWEVAASCTYSNAVTCELDCWRIAIDNGLLLSVEQLTDENARFVTVHNTTGATVLVSTLSVFHAADEVTHKVLFHGEIEESTVADDGSRTFVVGALDDLETLRVVFAIEKIG